MGENGAVLLQSRINARHKSDIVIRHGVRWSIKQNSIRRKQILIHGIHRTFSFFHIGCIGKHCPCIGLQMYLSFRILRCSDLLSVLCDTADEPFLIPQFPVADISYPLAHRLIFFHILRASEIFCQLQEVADRPVMQEGHHRALSAA